MAGLADKVRCVMKRRLIAIVAIVVGGAVSAALLVMTDPSRGSVNVWAAARDVTSGSQLDTQAIALVKVGAGAEGPLLFTAGEGPSLMRLRATHDLVAGQLIQRSDVTSSQAPADMRLVFVPLKDAPPVARP